MAGFDIPARDIRANRSLAVLCLVVAAACVLGLLAIGLRGTPAAALKQGQSIGFTAGRRS